MHSKRTTARSLILSALVSTSLLAGMAPATAGPDDGKIVTTKGHVDAPKAYWENGNFSLKNQANARGKGNENYDLDTTVNWVGKGWSGDGKGTNQYIFTVGDSSSLSWLGAPGKNYYMGPQLPTYNHDPIWAGMGADSNIPVEMFRSGAFVTDILSVDGPGTMDLFGYTGFGNLADSERLMSSTLKGLHSYLLSQGTHTHNYTVFSRPGRYAVTYRTVARSADGTQLFASKPSTLVWQVGGQQPISGDGVPNAVSTEERYKTAPKGKLEDAKYSLTLTPHEGRERDGDDKLTDITFTSDSIKKGTLTLYNNGYFLTDLTVEDGTVTWQEMLGSEESQIQAVFTPAEGEDGARWISNPVPYKESEKTGKATSQDGNGTWPEKIQDERNTTLETGNYTPTSGDYTVSLSPTEDSDVSLLEVKFADPKFRGFIRGGFYEKNDSVYPVHGFAANVIDGEAKYYVDAVDLYKDHVVRVDVVPHPDMNANNHSTTLSAPFESTKAQDGKGTFETTSDATEVEVPAPSDKPADPAMPAPKVPVQPEKPSDKCVLDDQSQRAILDHGHVDIQAKLEGDKLDLSLKDDTAIITPDSQQRSLNDVILAVRDNAKHHRNAQMKSPALDFIGEQGTPFYGLPQTQAQGIIWPGYNTENVDFSKLDGGVTLHLDPVKVPENARFGMYEDRIDGPQVLLNSEDKDYSLDVPFATHVHANWVFTEAGQYIFDTYYSATLADGTEIKSPVQQLAFAVGNEAVEACAGSTGESEKPGQGDGTIDNEGKDDKGATDVVDEGIAKIQEGAKEQGTVAGDNKAEAATTGATGKSAPAAGNSASQAGTASSQSQGGLAHTGFGALTLVGAGALLLVAGAALLMRRRAS